MGHVSTASWWNVKGYIQEGTYQVGRKKEDVKVTETY